MDDQSRTADNIRCSVCGDPCFEGHGGTLHGDCPNDAGGSARYLAHLCQGCFCGALSYLRQERKILSLFDDQLPASDDSLGLIIDADHQVKP